MRYYTPKIWAVGLLLSESHAIIKDLDVILHVFMLHIIYTTVFRIKQLNNITLHVRLFNRLAQKTVVYIIACICVVKSTLESAKKKKKKQ